MNNELLSILAVLGEAEAKATKDLWEPHGSAVAHRKPDGSPCPLAEMRGHEKNNANRDFIALSRNSMKALLSLVKAQAEEIEEHRYEWDHSLKRPAKWEATDAAIQALKDSVKGTG